VALCLTKSWTATSRSWPGHALSIDHWPTIDFAGHRRVVRNEQALASNDYRGAMTMLAALQEEQRNRISLNLC
jgi:hypothetical protein